MMCYQCGMREATINGLCEPCFIENQPPLNIHSLKVLVCKECGDHYINTWKNVSLSEIIKEYIGLKNFDCTIKAHGHGNYTVSVTAHQIFHKTQTHPIEQKTQFPVYVKESLCGQCSKMLSGYYQAVLQVRRETHVLTKKERDKILDIVITDLRRTDFISQIKERKEGTDYYFSTAKAAKRAANSLKKQLGGTIKESYHTVGMDRQTGTDIKRGTILFSLHKYKPGDIILLHNDVYTITKSSQKLHMKNAHTEKVIPWKKVEYLENQNEISVLPESSYTIQECQMIDVTPSQILIMRPNFSTVYLKRPKDIKVQAGEYYCILFYQGSAYWM
ncbi:MAG: NMD3-related protein [Candidatus Methanofastidiosia archaeon]